MLRSDRSQKQPCLSKLSNDRAILTAVPAAQLVIFAFAAFGCAQELKNSGTGIAGILLLSLISILGLRWFIDFRSRHIQTPKAVHRGSRLAPWLASGFLLCGSQAIWAQRTFSWTELRAEFEAKNPTLQAARIGVDESRAQEITAYLRPNPSASLLLDQISPFSSALSGAGNPVYRPLSNSLPSVASSYLHERQHKRELRRESARGATSIAESQVGDQARILLFTLRSAFIQTLQAKAVFTMAQENLNFYDRVLGVSRERFKVGDIAQVDLDRLELQRVQYESDLQTALVTVRTAKIQLLTLLNDRTPVERFEVTGPFDFGEQPLVLDELRRVAFETRPDLRVAAQTIEKAITDHRLAVANGSTDPTFGMDFARNPPIPSYFGVNVTIPLRIFDRNQGEKQRTQLDILRNERLKAQVEAQVYSDVDSAFALLNSSVALLRPYKSQYLQQASRIREITTFSFQRGGAALLDFLQAEQQYRIVQVSYLNLVGAYLNSANQLNLAVNREVIQ